MYTYDKLLCGMFGWNRKLLSFGFHSQTSSEIQFSQKCSLYLKLTRSENVRDTILSTIPVHQCHNIIFHLWWI